MSAIDDADQRDVRKVQALGDHLRADEDVDLAGPEIAEDPVGASPCCVVVSESIRWTCACGKQLREHDLHALRAEPREAERRVAARRVRALLRHLAPRAADVADAARPSAGGTSSPRCTCSHCATKPHFGQISDVAIAAPVEEQHGLLGAVEPLLNGLDAARAKRRSRAPRARPRSACPRCASPASCGGPRGAAGARARTCPLSALQYDSSAGVAEPSTTAHFSMWPRITATSRAL